MHSKTTEKNSLPPAGEGGYVLALVLVYIFSRTLFSLKGGYFTARPLFFAKQYLDPVLLENDLLAGLLHLHSQPPLFNFFLGLVLKISPDPALTYELLFKTAGLLIPILLFGTLSNLGIRRFFAFLISLVFMLNPTLFLYENLLYYTHFEAFFILLAGFCLSQWNKAPTILNSVCFSLSLLCLGMIRSLFHPLFFIILIAVLAGFCLHSHRKTAARTLVLASLLIFIPMALLCTKNLLLYDFFGTSSWTGMSLWIKANTHLEEQLEEFEHRGIVSPLGVKAELEVFKTIDNYFDEKKLAEIGCHHPADCNILKSSGKPNYNHAGYTVLSRQLFKDAFALIRRDPGAFAFYTLGSYSLTLWHSSDSVHALFEDNMKILYPVERIYRFLNFGVFGIQNRHSDTRLWNRTILVSAIMVLVYGVTVVNLLKQNSRMPFGMKMVCLFCLIIHTYTIAVSSFIEFGENNRFRFPVDSAFLILIIANLSTFLRKAQEKSI